MWCQFFVFFFLNKSWEYCSFVVCIITSHLWSMPVEVVFFVIDRNWWIGEKRALLVCVCVCERLVLQCWGSRNIENTMWYSTEFSQISGMTVILSYVVLRYKWQVGSLLKLRKTDTVKTRRVDKETWKKTWAEEYGRSHIIMNAQYTSTSWNTCPEWWTKMVQGLWLSTYSATAFWKLIFKVHKNKLSLCTGVSN